MQVLATTISFEAVTDIPEGFYRDMALGGPYFSKFLLMVIFAHACRHTRADDPRFVMFRKGESFLEEAKALLVTELETPKVPTIQALLILGGRQCAIGKTSEGWLYTAMAIGMIKDMGLHLPLSEAEQLDRLEPDDLESRKRLFCSAYAWDKSISITLGRPPSLLDMPYRNHCLLDDTDDLHLWQPVYLEIEYPPTPGFVTSTFTHFCELSQVINSIYSRLYMPNSRKGMEIEILLDLERQLQRFRDGMKQEIRIDDAAQLPTCPPPHIVCLNVSKSQPIKTSIIDESHC